MGIIPHPRYDYPSITASQEAGDSGTNVIGILWNTFMAGMISYFLLSIVESLALSFMKESRKKTK